MILHSRNSGEYSSSDLPLTDYQLSFFLFEVVNKSHLVHSTLFKRLHLFIIIFIFNFSGPITGAKGFEITFI